MHSGYFLVVEAGKHIHSMMEESNAQNASNALLKNNKDPTENPRAELQLNNDGPAKKVLMKYAQWSNSVGLVNMGIPFNRFIAFSASYLVFLLIIMTLILHPIFMEKKRNTEKIEQVPLLKWTNCSYITIIYILALLEKDFENFYRLKSVHRVLSNFWRLYDLIFHLFFVFHFVLHLTLEMMDNVDNCTGRDTNATNGVIVDTNKGLETFNEAKQNCEYVETILSLSGVLFAIGK